MSALRAEFVAALVLLTRLPIASVGHAHADAFAGAVWAYPIVGAMIGAIGAAVYTVCTWVDFPISLAAVYSLGAIVLVTGGLHEDALADTADGFGGGLSRERKLEIMRDSRVGTFGVLALVFTVAVRGVAIASLAAPGKVATALVTAGGLGRGAMVLPLMLLAPVRVDGLGAGLATTSKARLAMGLLLAAVVPLMLLPTARALGTIATAIAVAALITALAWRQIRGYSGDVLGATEVMVECAVLSVLAATETAGTQ